RIGGGTRTQQTIFETALYHSLLHPNVFSDSNGQYRGFDGRVHRAPRGRAEYANYSGWDTYRSQVQLEALVAPHQTSDMVRSMLDDYAQTGQLPKWNFDGSETYVMVGDPADSIIADAYAFGARHFDTGEALTAMQAEANQPNDVRPGQAYDENDGYLPSDGGYGCCNFYGPVSTQLEYDTADHAIAAFAADLGRKGISSSFARRASNWQNVFDPASGYLEPKNADGRFASHVGPSSTAGFVEGTSAQYTPMVPFDVAGLAAAAGGDAAWVARLDSLTSHIRHPGPRQSDFGNEPSLEVPWEYDYVGAPYRAQRVVRRIERELYLPKPAGIAGNDDLGEMSSWYVFAALGFYPETPGTADLALGSALFPRAALHLPSGRTLTVDAPKAAIGSPYVHAMTVDGRTWRHAYLPASLVSSGGTVDETLSATPDPGFGATAADAPPSDGRGSASALGYTDKHVVTAAPGQTVTFAVGARNLQPAAQDVSWSASSDADLGLVPQSGTLALPAGGRRSATVSVTAPSTVGSHLVTVDLSPSAAGATPPPVVIEVDVVASG
ncbi:glycoside hydrolase family 92 protein, partial [Jatrophihabitans endophyticus]|uniref:glycoside hydrolase family 92 protein n=1 Tax=Jatrophihabitans endophyticus TaxID=1206085 RepID=UPI0019F98F18